MERSLGRGLVAGKPRNKCEGEVLKEAAKLVNTINRCTMARQSECSQTTGEVMDRTGAEGEEKAGG
jgi:hypothetical protein